MKVVMESVRFGASPVFFVLAALLRLNPTFDHGAMSDLMSTHMAMMGMQPSRPFQVFGHVVPTPIAAALPSMWLMYVLMGVFHLSPWLGLFSRKRS